MTNTTDDSRSIYYSNSGDYAAYYINGKLKYEGHLDVVQEYIVQSLGVNSIWSDDFLVGNRAVTNLADIDKYLEIREANHRKAESLRNQADDLLIEAQKLENE